MMRRQNFICSNSFPLFNRFVVSGSGIVDLVRLCSTSANSSNHQHHQNQVRKPSPKTSRRRLHNFIVTYQKTEVLGGTIPNSTSSATDQQYQQEQPQVINSTSVQNDQASSQHQQQQPLSSHTVLPKKRSGSPLRAPKVPLAVAARSNSPSRAKISILTTTPPSQLRRATENSEDVTADHTPDDDILHVSQTISSAASGTKTNQTSSSLSSSTTSPAANPTSTSTSSATKSSMKLNNIALGQHRRTMSAALAEKKEHDKKILAIGTEMMSDLAATTRAFDSMNPDTRRYIVVAAASEEWFGTPEVKSKLKEADALSDHRICATDYEQWIAMSMRKRLEQIPRPHFWTLVAFFGAPFFAMGFLDNCVFIFAGDIFDQILWKSFGVSGMICAGLGGIVAGTFGLQVHGVAVRLISRNVKMPETSTAQRGSRAYKTAKHWGGLLGLAIGLSFGTMPLLFLNQKRE